MAVSPLPGPAEEGDPTRGDEAGTVEVLARAEASLAKRKSVQCNLKLEVTEGLEKDFLGPDAAGNPILDALARGTQEWSIQVRGPARLHWVEKRAGGASSGVRECWYEGFSLYSKGQGATGLKEDPFFEEEGDCLMRSLVQGGLVGWHLSHAMDARLVLGKCRILKDEVLDGRPCAMVEHEIKIGGICGVYRGFPGCRVWIDRERLVPLRRELAITLKEGSKEARVRAVETYTGWRLDESIPDEAFHVAGMGPPDPIGDLPTDPDEFERIQTERALGVAPRSFPAPQGEVGFDELPPGAPEFAFEIQERAVSGPPPDAHFEERKIVVAKAPDGAIIEARCTDDEDEAVKADPRFQSTRTNRRHRSGIGAEDIYLGRRRPGKLKPLLFFRDVGSQETAPHHVAVDEKGLVNLTVADVDIGNDNRLKLYWAVGDLATGKWLEAWIVDHRREFTSWSRPWSGSWGDRVHAVWTWEEGKSSRRSGGSGIFHVERKGSSFGRKVRVTREGTGDMGAGLDPSSGRLLLVWSTEQGVFAASKPDGEPWTRPSRLEPSLSTAAKTLVVPEGQGKFMVRTGGAMTREWVVTPR